MKRQTPANRSAFTLVEILIVVAIIGILMGLALAGITAARKAIIGRALALEIESLSQAVDAYKLKHGGYPPDGSSRTSFEAHFRAAFPNILGTEFTALYSASNSNAPVDSALGRTGVMDPAEALVFCLGGFSKDPTRPFTGPGGPLAAANGGGYQYNLNRNEPFFDFSNGTLTLDTSGGNTVSVDEVTLGVLDDEQNPLTNDVLPAYIPKNRTAPIAYFCNTTYRVDLPGSQSPTSNPYFNHYTTKMGIARPYKSDTVNTKIDPTNWNSLSVQQRDRYYMYANDKSFQIVCAGLDDEFGGATVFFRFKSGTPLDVTLAPNAQPSGANYALMSNPQVSQLDNVTNFSEDGFKIHCHNFWHGECNTWYYSEMSPNAFHFEKRVSN